MTISIIIATFNAAKTLNRCLDSIVPQLTKETELILVDGGSKDHTNKIIDSYGDKVNVHISERDTGLYDAWNKGVKAANGDWITFIGADDILCETAIHDYLLFLKKLADDVDLVSSKRVMIDEKGKIIRTVGAQWSWPFCLKGMPISHPGALHSKKLFKNYGFFSLEYRMAADYEFLLRNGKNIKTAFLDKVTIIVSEGGISDSYKAIKEYYLVLKHCPEVPVFMPSILFLNLFLRYTLKKAFRTVGINVHS